MTINQKALPYTEKVLEDADDTPCIGRWQRERFDPPSEEVVNDQDEASSSATSWVGPIRSTATVSQGSVGTLGRNWSVVLLSLVQWHNWTCSLTSLGSPPGHRKCWRIARRANCTPGCPAMKESWYSYRILLLAASLIDTLNIEKMPIEMQIYTDLWIIILNETSQVPHPSGLC